MRREDLRERVAMTTLAPDARIDVPAEVAVCPYCKARLVASFEEWEQNDDGTWSGISVCLDCVTEPDIDSDEWEGWMDGHSQMPYVYMLPVCVKVEAWINERYRFACDDPPEARRE